MSFKELAEYMLNGSILEVKEKKYRLAEIEFYLYNDEHKDTYAHCQEDQKKYNSWYFHKRGKSYIGGTRKGLDYTLGNEKSYFGILIRSMICLDTESLIEGPCLCVNKILEDADMKSIDDFVSNNIKMDLVKTELKKEDIYIAPRIGLNDTKNPEFRNKEYRFLICKDKIKKEKRKMKKLE